MNIFYVYLKFCIGGIPLYVGKGKGRRCWEHETCGTGNRQLSYHIGLAKVQGQRLPTVILAADLPEDEAFRIERLWIKIIGRGENGPLVNWTDGGEGPSGLIHSEKTRALLSLKGKGRAKSDHFCIKMQTSMLGNKNGRGHVETPERRQKSRERMLGFRHTEEAKAKMRAAWAIRRQRRIMETA